MIVSFQVRYTVKLFLKIFNQTFKMMFSSLPALNHVPSLHYLMKLIYSYKMIYFLADGVQRGLPYRQGENAKAYSSF